MPFAKKIQNIQVLRGLAIVLVILYHLMSIEHGFSHRHKLLPDLLKMGSGGVDLFFVISGFVMVTVTRANFGGLRKSGYFIYRRAARIYPLY